MVASFDLDLKDQARTKLLWSILTVMTVVTLCFVAAMKTTFCWSIWGAGLPLFGSLIWMFRVGCPDTLCIVICPDAPPDIIDTTKYFEKSLVFHLVLCGLLIICTAMSVVWSQKVRSACNDHTCAAVTPALKEDECDAQCGCSESTVMTIGFLLCSTLVASLVTVMLLRNIAKELGTKRRAGRFDRLQESSSSEGEQDEEDEVEMAPTAKQTALKGIAAGMMSSLGDALGEPEPEPEPEPSKPPTATKSKARKPVAPLKEKLMDAGSPPSDSISDDDFSEFMAAESRDPSA